MSTRQGVGARSRGTVGASRRQWRQRKLARLEMEKIVGISRMGLILATDVHVEDGGSDREGIVTVDGVAV